MKRITRSYLSFTHRERTGIVCLSILIIILTVIRATMPYWVRPKHDKEQEQKYIAAWEVYKRSQPIPVSDTVSSHQSEYADRGSEDEAPLPAIININTADSATLVRLKGIGPAMTHKIIAYRKKHKFKKVDELLDVQTIAKGTFEAIRKHLTVDSSEISTTTVR